MLTARTVTKSCEAQTRQAQPHSEGLEHRGSAAERIFAETRTLSPRARCSYSRPLSGQKQKFRVSMTSRYCAVNGPPSKKCSAARGVPVVRQRMRGTQPHAWSAASMMQRISSIMLRVHMCHNESRADGHQSPRRLPAVMPDAHVGSGILLQWLQAHSKMLATPCQLPESKPAVVMTCSSLSPMPAATVLMAARIDARRFTPACAQQTRSVTAANPGDLPGSAMRTGVGGVWMDGGQPG